MTAWIYLAAVVLTAAAFVIEPAVEWLLARRRPTPAEYLAQQHDQVEHQAEHQAPAKPLIRPATPDLRPAQVWQRPEAVGVDPPTFPLRPDERREFDRLVYAHDFIPAAPEPTPRSKS